MKYMLNKDEANNKSEKQCNEKKSTFDCILTALLIMLISAAVLSRITNTFIVQRAVVIGDSMSPTLVNNDNLVLDKLIWKIKGLKRFDIIVIESNVNNDKYIIKRVIALPGESIRIDEDGNIFINDKKLDYKYAKAKINFPGRALDTITLGKNEYFVIGDNANNSLDSRFSMVGNIQKSKIIGKLVWVLGRNYDN